MKKIITLLCTFICTITYPNTISIKQLNNLAETYKQNEQYQKAIICYETIINTKHNSPQEWFKLGCCALAIGQFNYALKAFDTVLHYIPDATAAWYNKGYTYKQMGKLDESIVLLKELIEKHPNYDAAYICLAYSYMMKGDMITGYKYHERHLKKANKYAPEFRELFNSMNLSGKTILLVPEGGLGDTLQYIRYAKRIKQYGAHIIAAVQPSLIPLLQNCHYIDEIIPTRSKVPQYDARISLMSISAALSDSLETIPKKIPYLFADKLLVEQWKNKLQHDTNFKIGICWQVSVKNDESRMPVARRDIPLKTLSQLFDIPGTSWYSLQQKDGLQQLQEINTTKLHIFNGDFDTTHGAFMDTAAVIQNLDLIISVDTSIGHLAGALGKPVWLLISNVPDWRRIIGRTDCPWYPTMRIFKQPEPFDWKSVVDEVRNKLEKIIH